MVRLWLILALFVALGCGSRRKQVHQERERTAQSVTAQADQQVQVKRADEQNMLVIVDEQGEAVTEVFNPEGTIHPDGSFTGRADRAQVRSTARRSQATNQATTRSQDSTSTSSIQEAEHATSETEKEDTSVAVRRTVPWYVWAGIAVLVAFAFLFGTPLKRIFKPFKTPLR